MTVLKFRQNADVEVFPFVTDIHLEVVLRHRDGESQDIEMAPGEAEALAYLLLEAAQEARKRKWELQISKMKVRL